MKLNKKILLLLLFSPFCLYPNVVLDDESYAKLLLRLKKDKQIIEDNQIRWSKLKTAEPIIQYTVDPESKKVIIQKIEIPIHKSTPLIYEIKFEVEAPEEESKVFPFNFFLTAMFETEGVDAKLGVQIINIERYFSYPLGMNVMIGIKSFGGSFSYSLEKPFDNTMIHVFYGKTYNIESSYGVGVSLNF